MKRLNNIVSIGFVLLVSCVFNSLSWANAPLIHLQSDASEIDYQRQFIRATDNITVLYGNIELQTNQLMIDNGSNKISIPSTFSILGKKETIRGEDFNYDTAKSTGHALNIRATIDQLKISCEKMIFAPEKVTLSKSSFTTCNDASKDAYIIRSNTIYLYPQWGYFIALNNKIDINFLPFSIPIPTYIYGAKKYGVSGATSLIPDIGSNRVEGFYVNQKVGYFFNPGSTGSLLFGSTKSFGFYGGITHQFTVKQTHLINIKTRIDQHTSPSGHISFDSSLSSRESKDALPSSFDDLMTTFDDSASSNIAVYATLQHREFVNDYRVSYAPLIGIKRPAFSWWKFRQNFDLNLANITEFDSQGSQEIKRHMERLQLNQALSYTLPWGSSFNPTFGFDFFGNWYRNQQTWLRPFARFSVERDYEVWKWKTSYSHALGSNQRHTPFQFEQQFAQTPDEVGLMTQFNWGRLRLQSDLHYDLVLKKARILDLVTSIKLRCWRLNIGWKTQENRLQFGLDLY